MTAAGIAVSATGAFAQAAPPANETVNFSGTVGSVCLFSNVVDGVLELDGGGFLIADPVGAPGSGGMGTPGSVDLECTGDVDVFVSAPQDNASSFDILTGAPMAEAMVEVPSRGRSAVGNNQGFSNSTGPMIGPLNETLSVGMFLDAGQQIPAGAYNYEVVVTAAPL